MKSLAWMLWLSLSLSAFAQDNSTELTEASKVSVYQKSSLYFSQGKYRSAVDELNEVEKKLQADPSTSKAQLGLISYWRGLAFSRLQEYPDAINNFGQALSMDYAPKDIHYEYGQALFAMAKHAEARIQFRQSLKKKFKRGVSLYYIAYLSKELGEKKKAVTFYQAIDKLGDEEAKEVKQAAEAQIGDIYLEQVESHPDAFRAVETYVIPQYQKALMEDENSKLAPMIKEKIIGLQRKYDLIMFQLRNGRPTLIPPYFFRAALETGYDTNVTFAPAETTIAKSKQGSIFSRADFIGRYTFYFQNFLSIAPEFRSNYTYYWNRIPEIYRNDNYLLAPAVRTSYEHSLWKKPASLLIDYDYNEGRRDIEANQNLIFSSRSHTFMVGERFNYFASGESIVRLRHRRFESYLSSSDASTSSLVFEQIRALKTNTLILYGSYDITRVKNSIYDTNGLTLRADFIMSRVRDWFTPSFGLGLTSLDPINDDSRGRELLLNPNLRLSKTIGKNWRGNLKYDYQNNKSKSEELFAYRKSLYSFELEYLF